MRLVCTPRILARASLEEGVTSLMRRLHCEQQIRTPSYSDPSSEDEEDGSYRLRFRTPPNESFSYDEDRYYEWRSKSPSHKGLSDDIKRSPNHYLHVESKGENFPGVLLSQLSSYTMEGRTS